MSGFAKFSSLIDYESIRGILDFIFVKYRYNHSLLDDVLSNCTNTHTFPFSPFSNFLTISAKHINVFRENLLFRHSKGCSFFTTPNEYRWIHEMKGRKWITKRLAKVWDSRTASFTRLQRSYKDKMRSLFFILRLYGIPLTINPNELNNLSVDL